MRGERDLLSLLPAESYEVDVAPIGVTRRGILLVNAPEHVRRLLVERSDDMPKSDLMVGALKPLVGDGIFITAGAKWRQQRRMLEPAFSHMRINRAFDAMSAATLDYASHLEALAKQGEAFSLEAGMSHLTADIIGRTIFSRTLESGAARQIFDDFARYQNAVANVEIRRLLWGRPFAEIPQPVEVTAACDRIRDHIGALIDEREAGAQPEIPDLCSDVIATRDPETGEAFTRTDLIDQIGTFFLAGHETTASVLTWCFFILSKVPEIAQQARDEIQRTAGDGPITFEHTKQLTLTRNIFRETLRLYPPLTFIPRVATTAQTIAGHKVKRGGMVMISPWIIHRHHSYWQNPDRFDPHRFEKGTPAQGAYLPFGLGDRVCIGAAFATLESTLILAELLRRFEFHVIDDSAVRPVARLTTRPAQEIRASVKLLI